MNESTKMETGRNPIFFAGALFLGFVLTFAGLWKSWEFIVRNAPPSLSTRAIALHYRINVLESRISDLESGAYYRRVATLVDSKTTAKTTEVQKIIGRLSGTVANERRELSKARKELTRLVGHGHAGLDAFAKEGATVRPHFADMTRQGGK